MLSFESIARQTSHKRYLFSTVDSLQCYHYWKKLFFDHSIRNYVKIYENIKKFATGSGDDYTTGSLLDYFYFKENYKLSQYVIGKQQVCDADPKETQVILFLI